MRVALVVTLLLATAAGMAATVSVGPGPPDAIAVAAKGLQPGDMLLIKAGAYAGNIALNLHGTAEQPITIRAAGDGPVIIEGRAEAKSGWQPVVEHAGVYVTADAGPVAGVMLDLPDSPWGVDDVPACRDLDALARAYQGYWLDAAGQRLYARIAAGASLAGHAVWVMRDGCGLAVTGEHLRIAGLTLRRFAGSGISVSSARNVTLEHCTVSHCGAVWSAGIQLGKTAEVTVADCVLYRVRNGVLAQDADGTRLTHNTIYHTRAHGVYLVSGSGAVLRDNIIFAGGGSGSALYVGPPAAAGLQSDHNCFLDTRTSALISWMPLGLRFATFWDYQQTIAGQDEHSFSADPLFVSTAPGQEDFRLKTDSPCRGKASDGGEVGVRW